MSGKTHHVKTAKGRKTASTRWLKRQLNDPYVVKANELGYRSRAAFKLLEIDEKFKLFKPHMRVIDLGAAPGGWLQVAKEKKAAQVVGLDLLPIDPLPDVTCLQCDFMDDDAVEQLSTTLDGPAHMVLSDMAPNTIGHKQTDHLRIMALVEMAYEFACDVLGADGIFIAKVFQGGAQSDLVAQMKKDFKTVRHYKPPASRKESSETYVIATGFKKIS